MRTATMGTLTMMMDARVVVRLRHTILATTQKVTSVTATSRVAMGSQWMAKRTVTTATLRLGMGVMTLVKWSRDGSAPLWT